MNDVERAAHRYHGPGITWCQAIILGFAELTGEPLDPYAFDDAAILLRAERLFQEEVAVDEALRTAREELVTWSVPS